VNGTKKMTDDAIADLARLRTIAEEGRRLPLMGGRHLILWGSVIALATVLHGAVFTQILPLPAVSVAFIWFGLTGMAGLLGRSGWLRGGKKRLRHDVGNRTERAVWQVGGVFLGLTAFMILLHGYWVLNLQNMTHGFALFEMMPALTFGVYAIALRVSAEVAALDTLKPFAWISVAMAGVSILLAGTAWQFPVTALGVICVSILPGLKLCALEAGRDNG
jgi:hypothetical protein